MRPRLLLLALPAVLAACGGAAGPDVLSGGSAAQQVKTAQAWLRGAGHYHFHETVVQRSAAENTRGVPAQLLQAMNGEISLDADGDVTGDKQVSAVAWVDGVPDAIHLIESGCLGFDSTDGSSWYSGQQPRWLARMVAPTMDDGLAAIAWHDLGATTHAGVDVHHLQATVTALGMSGSAPSPGATPPPGYTVKPTTADLYLRSSDGVPMEMDVEISATMDLSALAAGTAYAGASGTATNYLKAQAIFSSPRGGVTPPSFASAAKDPVPQQVYSGFGGFGVQKDSCDAPASG